jgi:selenocysteine-specific elongation factor
MSHRVIGTAGHIDHGKTSLVRALTGQNTDTLRDEQERGITIDIGFAFLGDDITIIDVPGHERFIKNMVSGVSTIDYVMLVIAADDGIMPQTREHLDILRLLGLKRGMVVISKAAMVDEDWLMLVEDDVREFLKGSFLEDAPVMIVDSLSGQGIPELRRQLDQELEDLPPRAGSGVFREVVDRVFNVHGHGTVITGTVLGGELGVGDDIEVQPGGHRGRVRSLQVHGATVSRVQLGDRAAINLQGIQLDQVERGCWIATPDVLRPGRLLDVKFILLNDALLLKHRDRVRVHVGTAELLARVSLMGTKTLAPGTEGYGQLLLEEDTAVLQGDRFVLRRYSPLETIGGGEILDPHPARHKPSSEQALERMQQLDHEEVRERLLVLASDPAHPVMELKDLQERTGFSLEELLSVLDELVVSQDLVQLRPGKRRFWLSARLWQNLRQQLCDNLEALHKSRPEQRHHGSAPLRQELFRQKRWQGFDSMLFEQLVEQLKRENLLESEAGQLRLLSHSVELSSAILQQLATFEAWLKAEACSAPKIEEMAQAMGSPLPEMKRLLSLALDAGSVLQPARGIFMHRDIYEDVLAKLRRLGHELEDGFTVSQANSAVGASRRFMVPFLEALDEKGISQRSGNFRRISG